MVDVNIVKQLLTTVCPCDVDEITTDKRLVKDLGLDSFGIMDMVITFEKEFNIEVPDRDLRLFNTVGDIVNYIDQKTSGAVLAQA